jgi:hypothetical protein
MILTKIEENEDINYHFLILDMKKFSIFLHQKKKLPIKTLFKNYTQ